MRALRDLLKQNLTRRTFLAVSTITAHQLSTHRAYADKTPIKPPTQNLNQTIPENNKSPWEKIGIENNDPKTAIQHIVTYVNSDPANILHEISLYRYANGCFLIDIDSHPQKGDTLSNALDQAGFPKQQRFDHGISVHLQGVYIDHSIGDHHILSSSPVVLKYFIDTLKTIDPSLEEIQPEIAEKLGFYKVTSVTKLPAWNVEGKLNNTSHRDIFKDGVRYTSFAQACPIHRITIHETGRGVSCTVYIKKSESKLLKSIQGHATYHHYLHEYRDDYQLTIAINQDTKENLSTLVDFLTQDCSELAEIADDLKNSVYLYFHRKQCAQANHLFQSPKSSQKKEAPQNTTAPNP